MGERPRPRHAMAALAVLLPIFTVAETAVQAREPYACGARVAVPKVAAERLGRFLARLHMRRPRAALGTIWTVHADGRLPRCYLTKRRAREMGWRRGSSLWRVAPGAAIGGDRFFNRERRLPPNFRYVEADLDYTGGRRGARRLVFARSTRGRWRIWITLDHYRSFVRVPAPR